MSLLNFKISEILYSPDYSHYDDDYGNNDSGRCGALVCFMRIAFTLMIIMLILMAIVTGVYYTLDLAVHSACRTVHKDRSFLIPFVAGNYLHERLFSCISD